MVPFDDGHEMVGQLHHQPPARQFVGAQMNSLSPGQMLGRGVSPAKGLQIGTVSLVRDTVIAMEGAAPPPVSRPPSPSVAARRHVSNLGGGQGIVNFAVGSLRRDGDGASDAVAGLIPAAAASDTGSAMIG